MCGRFSRVRLFATLWTQVHKAPLSTGFSRQKYLSEFPCPPPGHLPNPGTEPTSPVSNAMKANSLPTESSGKFMSQFRPRFHPWVGKIPWRRDWQPTPVFLPGESCGQRSLVGYGPWDRIESHMTEQLTRVCVLLGAT